MTTKYQRMHKTAIGNATLSMLSFCVVFALSACSGDNSSNEESTDVVTAETTPTETIESTIVDPQMPVVDTEVSISNAEPTVTGVGTDIAIETEVLAVDAGAKLYETQCKVCHASGLLNAPKYGDKAAWVTRISKDKETLYLHSTKGFNKMPAQVNDKVNDVQVHAAVDYMLEAVS
jgi:cytochrome c5